MHVIFSAINSRPQKVRPGITKRLELIKEIPTIVVHIQVDPTRCHFVLGGVQRGMYLAYSSLPVICQQVTIYL